MKRYLHTLNDFIQNTHKLGYSLMKYHDVSVPCIYVKNSLFENILKISYGKKIAVDTNLNIYDDGEHIFVNVNLRFLDEAIEEDFLLYANETLDFFKNLSETGMLGIAPKDSGSGSNVFFIQLPKIEQAQKAYELIKIKLKKN